MKRFVAAFVVLLASPAWADDADTSQMVIDAGRLGVMMDQAQRILGLPDDPPGDDSTDTFEILKSAVRQYDRLQPLACERHLVGAELCGALYICTTMPAPSRRGLSRWACSIRSCRPATARPARPVGK